MSESDASRYMKTVHHLSVVMAEVFEKQVCAPLKRQCSVGVDDFVIEMECFRRELHHIREHAAQISGLIAKQEERLSSPP